MTQTAAHTSGLARYRAKLAEERQRKVDEIAVYRESATTEERDGRTWTVVRIPDRYELTEPMVRA